MRYLPAPDNYRMTRWELIGFCCRHPILAWVASREIKRPAVFTDREKTLFSIALLHGVVAWLLT